MRYVRGRELALTFLLLAAAATPGRGAAGSMSGNLTYVDKRFTGDPPSFQDNPLVPIRGAVVEVWESGGGGLLVGASETVADGVNDGDYTVSFALYGESEATDVVLRCYAKTDSGSIEVKVDAVNVHLFETPVIVGLEVDDHTGPHDYFVPIGVGDDAGVGAGAFNIFDNCLKGREYVDLANGDQVIPNLTVYWPVDSSPGTHYDNNWPLTPEIHIQGGDEELTDPDDFDDAVILHEYGHFVAFRLSRDDSPGGPHDLDWHVKPHLAWSEGWASFYSSSVRGNKYYYDSEVGEVLSRWADLEDLSLYPAGVGSDNEVAVAAVLWDIVDNEQEAFDNLSEGTAALSAKVWDVMENYFPGAARVTTLETFWDGWVDHGYVDLTAIFDARGIEYKVDTLEDDDILGDATMLSVGGSVHHTYYPADPIADVDWTVFNLVKGKNYVIETVNLTNAADTVLELYEPGGVDYVAIHDDVNGEVDPSSKIEFTAAQTGTYAVKSYAYAMGAYPGADIAEWVRYGSYDLKLTTPSSGGGGGGGGCFLGSWRMGP